MKTVANCFDFAQAQSIRIALESNGIEAFIPDENVAVAAPHLFATKSGVRVQVLDDDAPRAAAIIGSLESGADEKG